MGEFRLLGDSAYICRHYPFIVTPKRDDEALSVADQQLNASQQRQSGGGTCIWTS